MAPRQRGHDGSSPARRRAEPGARTLSTFSVEIPGFRGRQRLPDYITDPAAGEVLRQSLLRADFEGPEWTTAANHFAVYALRVLNKWLANGQIFSKCEQLGCPVGPRPKQWSVEDRAGIVHVVIAEALRELKDKSLRKGEWRVDGGASLGSYFITGCIFKFPNAYRMWKSEQSEWTQVSVHDFSADAYLFERETGGDTTSARIMSKAGLEDIGRQRGLTVRDRQLLFLVKDGYRHKEIAELMHFGTVRAVGDRLHRLRKALRRKEGEAP